MNISIEGVISKCNNILNGLGNLNPWDDYSYSDICDIVQDLNNDNPKFYAHLIKEFSYNLKLTKTQIDSCKTDEEKMKLVNELFELYCIKPFANDAEREKLAKQLEQ
jgi:hypothetical protein